MSTRNIAAVASRSRNTPLTTIDRSANATINTLARITVPTVRTAASVPSDALGPGANRATARPISPPTPQAIRPTGLSVTYTTSAQPTANKTLTMSPESTGLPSPGSVRAWAPYTFTAGRRGPGGTGASFIDQSTVKTGFGATHARSYVVSVRSRGGEADEHPDRAVADAGARDCALGVGGGCGPAARVAVGWRGSPGMFLRGGRRGPGPAKGHRGD